MKKTNISKVMKAARAAAIKHSPEILTGIGIAGMITAAIMAVRATPKALDVVAEVKETHKDKTDDERLVGREIVKNAAPLYLPATITGAVSIACLIGASSVNARRNAALATAYTLSESALREYQEKVIETIGEKKEQAVRDAVAKDKLKCDPVVNNEVIITGYGDSLCYDSVAKYFKCDIEKIRRAENVLNKRLMSEMYISLNDFYYEIGVRPSELGDDLGWNIDDGLIDFHFSSQLTENGIPCLVIGYRIAPRYDFRKLM